MLEQRFDHTAMGDAAADKKHAHNNENTATNARLSHPEQVRRFTIIDKPLSIAAGELTPNLKVRRNQVEAHYQTEIDRMYQA